jgi:hypothetical protein
MLRLVRTANLCCLRVMNLPATRLLGERPYPMARPCLRESWLWRGGLRSPRALSAQSFGATIFPCACRAFLASQNRRASRSSTVFPPLRGAPRPVLA